jgi:hypothetical protein
MNPRGRKLHVLQHDDGTWWIHDEHGPWDGPWPSFAVALHWAQAIDDMRTMPG